METTPTPNTRPLFGITVLDLTRVLSGPFATLQLADLGARVIKIEHPDGDDTRRFGPPFLGGESTYFLSVNRSKESVCIDMKKDEGRELVVALALISDVVVENFRPGVAERLQLGMEMLRAMNPSLVTCSISGFGSHGAPEFQGLPGYDVLIQAVSGLMALTGEPDGPPCRVGIAIADLVAGLYAAQGILAALALRSRTGAGTHVDISMQDAVASLLTYQAGIYFATGRNPPRMGNAHPSICPYGSVEAKDGMYVLAVGNDEQFDRLVHALDLPWLADDERFRRNDGRVEHRDSLMQLLAPKFRERTRAEWDQLLRASNIPGGAVLPLSQALEHPQLEARGSISRHAHPTAGTIQTVATPVRFDRQPPACDAPPPTLGEHTRSVLTHDLHLSDEHIDRLEERHAIRLQGA